LIEALVIVVALYAVAVAALAIAGRRADAAALARFVPDCVILVRRLLGDPRLPRRSRLALLAVLGYLVCPIDLVPDFIPVAGQLDDAVLLALVLRHVVRVSGAAVIREHWPGPPRSLVWLSQTGWMAHDVPR
jgi:uncharacterized membrane protein YkvA (DUF1232 family)